MTVTWGSSYVPELQMALSSSYMTGAPWEKVRGRSVTVQGGLQPDKHYA